MRSMRRPTLLIGIGLAAWSVASPGGLITLTSSIVPLGWAGAQVSVNGVTTNYINNGQTTLPNEVSSAIDGQGIITVGAASADVNVNYVGTLIKDVKAQFVGSYRITTSELFPESLTWTLVGQERMSAYSSGVLYTSGATAEAVGVSIGEGGLAKAQISKLVTPYDEDEKSDGPNGPKIKKRSIKLHDLIWLASPGGGGKSCTAKVRFGVIGGRSRVKGPGLSGNYYAAGAAGSGGYSLYPTGVKSSGGGGVLTVSVPAGRNAVSINIYNSSGNLVDEWTCDAENGTAELYIDDYAAGQYVLAFKTYGTLVKKITLNLNPSTSQTVNPTWKYGDLNDDNVVTQAEVNFVQSHIGATISSDPMSDDHFPSLDLPYTLARADLNGDGQITQADYLLVLANLGVTGD